MAPDKRVLMVRTFHFTSKRDFITHEVDDMRAPRRQAELEELADRLARYEPTKVMIEYPFAQFDQINDTYARYVRGEYQLSGDEREQIGWRLARRLRHTRVYPVDIRQKWWEEGLETNPKLAAQWNAYLQTQRKRSEDMDVRIPTSTVTELLASMNQRQHHKGIGDYLTKYVRWVDGEDYSGADVVGNWYHRNIRIYANILRFTEPGDRLFILYGGSHIPLFRHLFNESGEFVIDDPLPYLTNPLR